MSKFKEQLVKLGAQEPSLQQHLRPILDSVCKTARMSRSEDPAKFDRAVQGFIRGAQKIVTEHYKDFPLGVPVLEITGGRRYLRIAKTEKSSRSAYAFIDTETGDVLKAASWKKPARHARSNIFDSDFGVGAAGPNGMAYLR